VANSDFDLQYNGGTVLALDLDRLREMVPEVWNADAKDPAEICGKELPPNAQRLLYPGLCSPIDLSNAPDGKGSLITASVQLGAFATDILTVARPRNKDPEASGARLFVPVRGDPSVTWIEIDDDRDAAPATRTLYCGQTRSSPRCDALHRAGEDPNTNLRKVVLPPEPYGIAADESGTALVVTHQTTGSVSLLRNSWYDAPTPVVLEFVSGGFPAGGVGVAALPVPGFVFATGIGYQPGFLVTFRAAPEVDLARYYDDAAAAPERPFITRAAAIGITVNASGVDSRGIDIDASERRACEGNCSGERACLQACAAIPAQVYIANRTPPSLLVGETRSNVSPTGSDDLITIYDSVPLTFGASRVVVGEITDKNGDPQTRVFASCFDARYIFIYDPVGRRIDGHIRTGRGPHAMVVDPHQPFLYVAHFTDSYIGVVDLDQRHDQTYASIVASVGAPSKPRESK
ncbi:MAG: hypothetical protein MUF54_24590, partial [Polyangiaceae bacterium]|nr:hypothetical protein [Polyangiaceae bacterium]